ncbi:MAG: FAD-linked oxidase C-terminal domain-containing protein, partial [Thermoprotei archaeon]
GPGLANALVTRNAPADLFYAPDPSSYTVCSIGGNVSHDSGGIHVPKYGSTFNSVVRLRVALYDGSVEEVGGTPYFNGVNIFVGSEGGLGVVLRATLRLYPRPETTRTVLGAFQDVSSAARAVSALFKEGVVPAAVEMMDRNSIAVVERSRYRAGYPDCGALLLVECDGYTPQVDGEVERVRRVFESFGAEVKVPENSSENSRLWLGRKGAFPAMGVVSPAYLTLDSIVPRTQLAQVLEDVGRIAEKHGVMVANVFHAADGNLHPLIPYNPEVPESLERALRAGWEIVEASMKRGGVPSGEHGIGIEKARFMYAYYTKKELEVLWRIKRVFDPKQLLNPYKTLYEEPPKSGESVVSLLYAKPWEAE